jgi:glycosyltransferase involved in cell wall biosynthesis
MISVLLPTYNDEKYIHDTISSILCSSFKDFELLIINDGSNDDTVNQINRFNDPRIKLVSKVNSGLIETLNYGFNIAKFDLVARIDGDDMFSPNRLQKQYDLINKFNFDIVGSNAIIINENSDPIGKTDLPISHDEIKNKLIQLSPAIIHPSLLIKKDCVISEGGYNELYKHCEDLELWVRLIDKYKFYNSKECLISLRKHSSNISKQFISEQILNSNVARYNYINRIPSNNLESFKSVRKKINKSLSFIFLIFLHKINSNINYRFINRCLNVLIILITKLNNLILKKI